MTKVAINQHKQIAMGKKKSGEHMNAGGKVKGYKHGGEVKKEDIYMKKGGKVK